MNWYLDVLKKYAVFNGRARRKEYWMFALINFVVAAVLMGIEISLGGPGIIANLYLLAVLLPSIGVSIRRLHDTNRSGWWLLICLVPFLGAIVLLIFLVLDGTPGENKFGPNPKR